MTARMSRYKKHTESSEVAQHIRFYDRGQEQELTNVIELDPAQDNGLPNGKRISLVTGQIEDCYYKDCMVVVDGIVDPPEETMIAFRNLHKMKHYSTLPTNERHALLKGLAEEVRKDNARNAGHAVE